MQQEINIAIGAKSPEKYFKEINEQVRGGSLKYGNIKSVKELHENLEAHCIPLDIFEMNVDHFDDFLIERRSLIAEKIKSYYYSL
jgi:hypothetical protein